MSEKTFYRTFNTKKMLLQKIFFAIKKVYHCIIKFTCKPLSRIISFHFLTINKIFLQSATPPFFLLALTITLCYPLSSQTRTSIVTPVPNPFVLEKYSGIVPRQGSEKHRRATQLPRKTAWRPLHHDDQRRSRQSHQPLLRGAEEMPHHQYVRLPRRCRPAPCKHRRPGHGRRQLVRRLHPRRSQLRGQQRRRRRPAQNHPPPHRRSDRHFLGRGFRRRYSRRRLCRRQQSQRRKPRLHLGEILRKRRLRRRHGRQNRHRLHPHQLRQHLRGRHFRLRHQRHGRQPQRQGLQRRHHRRAQGQRHDR